MALSADRNTPARDGDYIVLGVAAAKKLYAGALVALDASGYATPGATATTLKGLGRCEALADNSSGAAAAINATIKRGIFRWANSSAADEIADDDIGKRCYIVDDQTVALTNGSGTRSVAGIIYDVDSTGVWVDHRGHHEEPSSVGTTDIADDAVTTAKIADDNVTYALLEESTLQYATVAVSNAEIKAMAASPKTLVAAPGANKVLEFVSAIIQLNAGSEALTESADNMAIRYTDGSGAIVSETIEATGFIDQVADTISNAIAKADAIVASASAANQALVLDNTGGDEYAGNASADATLTVKIVYRVHDFS